MCSPPYSWLNLSTTSPVFTLTEPTTTQLANTQFLNPVSIIYVRSGKIFIHFVTFSVQCHLIWPRTLYLIYAGPQADDAHRRRLVRRFWGAVATLVLAFAVWNVDLERCHALRALRARLGLPWAWLLELHGWWHLLTAVGAVEYVALVRTLCGREKGDGK